MPAWDDSLSFEALETLVNEEIVGGYMILNKTFTSESVRALNDANPSVVPLLVSIDAEPSLLKYRFPDPIYAGETAELETLGSVQNMTLEIAQELTELGVNLNFAPIYDTGANQSVIGDRAFSQSSSEVIEKANTMSVEFMKRGIIPTAKHFPGHGSVSGDTHVETQTIEGELYELPQFEAAVKASVPVMMVGHLKVANENYDTLGMPATLSALMMQDLLRKRLSFEGVVITDAMNMQGVVDFENADMNALLAGADIVLMPSEPKVLNQAIQVKMYESEVLRQEFEAKIKRVLRLKLVWQLSKY